MSDMRHERKCSGNCQTGACFCRFCGRFDQIIFQSLRSRPEIIPPLESVGDGETRVRFCWRAVIVPGFVHVVDDDAAFRTSVERRLKIAGYEVATYPSGQHLLERLPDEGESGCILLDVKIPGLSGPELQGRLSELGSMLPIIFLTGYPDVQTTVRTVKAGAEDFLAKPVAPDQLLQANRTGHCASHRDAQPEQLAGSGSRSYRNVDTARAASF
jgi:CheY-like chemotaxis protein